ncbi:MAG: LLM class flavin-dependent oxidoreductase [Promethearchaeota archaeon]
MVLKIGIHIPLEFFTSAEAVNCAQIAEAAGLDHVVVNDHLLLPWTSKVTEAWTTLAAIGEATQKIRVGTCVTPLPLRHPFLIAKMAASIDQLTGGRLIFGVGAGWLAEEFGRLGVPFLQHGARLKQMEEALQFICAMWQESKVTFSGRYYQAENVVLEPKPVQSPHPPIYFGGGSSAILKMTAQYGNGWMPFSPTPRGIEKRLAILEPLLKAKNRKLNEIQILPSIVFQLGTSQKDAWQKLPTYLQTVKLDEASWILGTPEECVKQIGAYVTVGVTHIALRMLNPSFASDQIRAIADEIIPSM